MTGQSAPKRAVIWAAVSTPEQATDDKESLPAQKRDLLAVAAANGWQVIDVLEIPGFSRRYLDLDEFVTESMREGIDAPHRLREHLRKGDFDIFMCRDGDRFGRSQSLFARIAEDILFVKHKAIFAQNGGGLVDEKRGGREWVTMQSYRSSKEVDELVRRRRETFAANREKGLHVAGQILSTHRKVRDDKGRIIALELDPARRQEWDDLAVVILEGVYWQGIERVMFERYGHGRNGKRFAATNYYHYVMQPLFWGHIAQHYHHENAQGFGLWRFEPGHEIPDGVQISYNVVEPVYTGETAERVLNEIKRRKEIGYGGGRSATVMWWRGLFVCAGCRMNAGTFVTHGKYYIRCFYGRTAGDYVCDSRAFITERVAKAYISDFLERLFLHGPDMLLRLAASSPAPDVDGLYREMERLEDRARKIVRQKLDYDGGDLDKYFTEELQKTSSEIGILKRRIADAEKEITALRVPDTGAIERIRAAGIETFWTWDSRVINQLLHAILRDWRILIDRHEIKGFVRKR